MTNAVHCGLSCSLPEHRRDSLVPPDELRYLLLGAIRANPSNSQRNLASELEVSIGRVNAELRHLMDRGLVDVRELGEGRRQRYEITPSGEQERAALAVRFIEQKEALRHSLKREIESLRAELESERGPSAPGERR